MFMPGQGLKTVPAIPSTISEVLTIAPGQLESPAGNQQLLSAKSTTASTGLRISTASPPVTPG